METRRLPTPDAQDIDNVPSTSKSAIQPEHHDTKRTGRSKASARVQLDATEPSGAAEEHVSQRHSVLKQKHPQKSLLVAGCLVAAAVATACLRHWLKRRKLRPKAQDVEPLLARCKLQPSTSTQAAGSAPLHDTSFVVSQVFYIEGLTDQHTVEQHGAESDTGLASASAVQAAIHAGATCVGRTKTPEAALGIIALDETRSNPAVPGAVVGITGSSAALIVAQQKADFALTSDHLAGARTSAACCGLYGYRPTRGAISMQGVLPIAGELDSVAWLTQSPTLLPRLGQAFSLPGGSSRSRTELSHLILAQDLFGLWGEELRPACSAALLAARKWAGDEVAPVSLLVYLRDSVPAAGPLMEEDPTPDQLMAAFGTAAALIQQSQFAHCRCRHASLDSTAHGSAGSMDEVDEESLAAAKQVQRELQKAMHAALSANNGILIVPTLPGPPIQRSASADELEQFERRTLELSSLATLSGIPQVCIPVHIAGQAVTSVSLLSLHKSDMQLLETAAKLGPLIAEAGGAVAEALAEEAQEQQEQQQAPANGQQGHASKAEHFKATANAAFKAGDYDGAITGYTGAIQADPSNPVYFSNRAMAYLKGMRFAEAKDDCDSALELELNVKTLLRRGTAWLGLQDIDSARRDFRHVLSLEPNNRQARQELQALKASEAMFNGPDTDVPNGGSTEGLL